MKSSMKSNMKKKCIPVLLLVLFTLASLSLSCRDVNQKLLKAMNSLETRDYAVSDMTDDEKREKEVVRSKEKIEELKKEIAKDQQIVDAKVQASVQMNVYYKMLTLEYLFLEMYGPALESVKKAIEMNPTNYKLVALAGVCTAQIGKSTGAISARNNYYLQAEYYYLRSLDLKEDYPDALYGLGVLYGYEMERYNSAKKYLEKLVEVKPKMEDARFALAHVYAAIGWIQEAGDQYDEIITTSGDKQKVKEAGKLKGELLGLTNGTE